MSPGDTMEMSGWQLALTAACGVLAGFVNTLAGGGTLLTMPLFILMGMPAALSNGSNRLALVLQNVVAVGAFRRMGFSDLKLSLRLAAFTIPGAVIGAMAAVKIDDVWFRRVLAVVMIGVLAAILWGARGKQSPAAASLPHDNPAPTRRGLFFTSLGMLGVGLYGGFIQAGVGFILMPVLSHGLKLDLVRVNMHKVFIIGVYMIPTLLVFVVAGKVAWLAGLVLGVGSAVGAVLATRLQIKRGEGPIRVVFAIAVLAMAGKLLLGD